METVLSATFRRSACPNLVASLRLVRCRESFFSLAQYACFFVIVPVVDAPHGRCHSSPRDAMGT
jgi:hypothetical protein